MTRLPDVDDDEVDDIEGADAVEFAVEDIVSEAAMDEDCAAAKPTRAVTMKELEKYMVSVFVPRESCRCIISIRL